MEKFTPPHLKSLRVWLCQLEISRSQTSNQVSILANIIMKMISPACDFVNMTYTFKRTGLSALLKEDYLKVESVSILESSYSTFDMPTRLQSHSTTSSNQKSPFPGLLPVPSQSQHTLLDHIFSLPIQPLIVSIRLLPNAWHTGYVYSLYLPGPWGL